MLGKSGLDAARRTVVLSREVRAGVPEKRICAQTCGR